MTTATLQIPPDHQALDPHMERPTMTQLKHRIAASGYEVDAELVAEEIVRKLRLLRWARRELVTGSGRTPGRPVHGH